MSAVGGLDLDFWLESSRWFGMTMYPGYGSGTYYSPIKFTGFLLLDNDIFELDFINLAYAQGVQDFCVRFEVLRGTRDYQICADPAHPDRTYAFVPLTPAWMRAHFPDFAGERLFDENGLPIEDVFVGPTGR